MSFLNPLMLLGVSAIAVPIIIHLLNKRKFQRVVWAAMRFLRVSVEQNQRRLRIEDLVLLAVRCALLAILALALARPAIRSAGAGLFGQAKVTAVIILDHSYSMSTTDGVNSRFEQAQRAAEEILNAMPSGSSTAVLLASDVVRGAIPEPTFDLNLARKIVREAPISDRGSNLMPAVQQAIEILQRKRGARQEIHLITDGQRHAWRQMESIRTALQQAGPDIHPHVILVGSDQQQNLAVTDLRLPGGLAPVGMPLSFVAEVTNFGRQEERDVRVSLRVNADLPMAEATIPNISPGQSATATLIGWLRSADYHTVTASITPDRVPADDQRTLAVRAVSQVQVLLVSGRSGLTARENATFFLRAALQPVPAAEADSYYVKVTQISSAELPAAQLGRYDAVMIADVPDFPDEVIAAMQSYVARGGGLVIFPGDNTQARFYNEKLYQTHRLLPAALGEPHGQADDDQQYFVLDDKALDHPVASVWRGGAGRPSAARFYRAYELVVDEGEPRQQAGPDGVVIGPPRVVLQYAHTQPAGVLAGKPAVVERTWGMGRVVQFASTANTDWTNLPAVGGVWLPLVHRTLGLIIQRQDEALNVPVGQKFVFYPGAEMLGKDVQIISPAIGSNPPARDLRRVEVHGGGGAPVLEFENTDLGGAYEASLAGDPPVVIRFAAQPDTRESALDRLTDAQLATLQSVAQVITWPTDTPLAQMLEKQRVGTELWLWLAIIALAVAVTETLLGHRFSAPK